MGNDTEEEDVGDKDNNDKDNDTNDDNDNNNMTTTAIYLFSKDISVTYRGWESSWRLTSDLSLFN